MYLGTHNKSWKTLTEYLNSPSLCLSSYRSILLGEIGGLSTLKIVTLILWLKKHFYFKNSIFLKFSFSKLTTFQLTLFVKIRTLVAWLKSTLLLKIECQDTLFKWKHNIYKQNEMQHYLGEKGKDRIAQIKSLIYARVGRGTCVSCPQRYIK